ncbi:hypothetical protein PC116_g13998 [Phytophthora cactorum]|nr:hypothetical protein PC119_g26637 [Phytophthora cactorum]KAG3124590.1 hypothetical protein PC128_g27462 [Phytophthora cactorum]KAG4237944.1 hypothetical protein PC116_g14000 [Phytophthora cactorum]KAG4237954.1 hypothetical protein PC116_g13998 [Phytophthora cactorum]
MAWGVGPAGHSTSRLQINAPKEVLTTSEICYKPRDLEVDL